MEGWRDESEKKNLAETGKWRKGETYAIVPGGSRG
jgi:hypothetical protein